MAITRPSRVTVRAYQVGFGDCFLLTFHYSKTARHVLIDFGSMRAPKHVKSSSAHMLEIANRIRRDCGGRLHVVVATHRHQDHISGFTRAGGAGPGEIIRNLKPDVVIQPWTEDPQAAKDAQTPTRVEQVRAFQAARASMATMARSIVDEARNMDGPSLGEMGARLAAIGMDNISNEDAVRNLQTMARKNNLFVHYGSRSGFERLLPGVKVHILGPPTLAQDERIRKQRSKDAEEFWMLQADYWRCQALAPKARSKNNPARDGLYRKHGGTAPPSARWFVRKVRAERASSLYSIVRDLDNAMNNTSVILLFEVGGRSLLFPGDAQYENWMYAMGQKGVMQKLSRVDLYKVGHHGSRNATPKTLWNNFKKATPTRELQTVLSTMAGVHGHTEATHVPRATLVEALEKNSTLKSTENLSADKLCEEVTIDL